MDHSEKLRAINQVNREFWGELSRRFRQRMEDPGLREMTFSFAENESRRVPVSAQNPLEEWSNIAERGRSITLREQASKGGRQQKTDALQHAIIDLARTKPRITRTEVRERLTREHYPDLIVDVDEEFVYYVEPDGSESGREKKARLSALKHRLSRAKKKLKSLTG